MSVKFQLASRDLPLILVRVNLESKTKSRLVTAIIDTGATGCVMTQDLATALELDTIDVPEEEKNAHGIGGVVTIEFVKAKKIALDQAETKNMRVAVMDMAVIHNQFHIQGISPKKKVEMILGYPFFYRRVLKIDYKTKTLSLK
ncbi:MAG: hypothetical protein HY22_00945 [[Candidatus Thermochlorobacteriaceae] bacterium GBChlB]|jgi:predicted aspartyl protease|nr:MAG: hypothetical protein HY22_00945 [[Candidatus Thermochlorobacteriaceae] bacterium GBChlB]